MTVHCPNGHPNRAGARFCAICRAPLASPPPATFPQVMVGLRPNTVLVGRYTITRWVGGGGMGAVYEAWDNRIQGRRVAVKELNAATIPDPSEMQSIARMFQQEAQLLAALTHSNLPKVSDFFLESNKQYLVMEFVEGQTLEKVLEQYNRPFSDAQVISIGAQLCDVLEYLHTRQPPIIFRDLKPSNIMVDQVGRIKLIDFGIARLYKPGKRSDTSAFGSPGYASPEQYGHGQTDGRSDIYSLGVTLYHLLTRYDPAIDPFNLPALRQLLPTVSPGLERAITKGMEQNIGKRWQNIGEMRNALTQPAAPRGATPSDATQRAGAGVSTARPTTRLILRAAELSPIQLMVALAVALVGVMFCAWLFPPFLVRVPVIWNNVDVIALVAPLVYAAVRRRFIAGTAHTLIASIGATVVWLSLGYTAPLAPILISAALTGIFVEGWLALINRVRRGNPDAWQRELIWLALMAAIATATLRALIVNPGFGLNPVLWLISALLGGVGWFLGDLVQQYLHLRQQGARRMRRY